MSKCRWVQRCASAEARVNAVGMETHICVEYVTCSEDETVAKGFFLSQGPTSASSSTSLTAVSDLRTPWSHSLSCWLPLLVEAGAGSCR